MSKVLLVDTNFSARPIHTYLVQAGHEVYVVGGNPHDFLAKCVDNYANFDYTVLDNTRQLILDRKIDFIVPGCNDRSYQVCAELNRYGDYPGIDKLESTATILNKERFRAFAARHRLPAPLVLNSKEIGKRWPVIVKPVDAYSGRGVTVIHKSEEHKLPEAITYARECSRTRTCIVEDYVEGQLYSHTAFIAQGEVIVDHIVEEHGTANPFVVDTSRVVYDFPEDMRTQLRYSVNVLANELHLCDGLVHTQFIKNGEKHWLIEVTRRCPGDLYSQLIELSTGSNYAENYVRPFINEPFDLRCNRKKSAWIMRHTISQSVECIFGSIQFHVPLHIENMVPLSLAGDQIKPSPHGRIAILFAKAHTETELNELFARALSRDLYTVNDYS